MVPYSDLSRQDIIDFNERRKVHHALPDYLEPNNVAKLEALTDEQLSFMRFSSSRSVNTLYTSPISMTRSRTSAHTPDLLKARQSFLTGNPHTYSTAHRTLRRGSKESTSVDGSNSSTSKNGVLGSRMSFLTGNPNTISALTSLQSAAKTPSGAKSISSNCQSPSQSQLLLGSVSASQSPFGKQVMLSPVHALNKRRRPGKFSPTPQSEPLPNELGYKGYVPSGSGLHRASVTSEFSRSLGASRHSHGGFSNSLGATHRSKGNHHSPGAEDSLMGGHTMSTISFATGFSEHDSTGGT